VNTEIKLYSFEEKRLARLLRQASLAYIRREYGRTQRFLGDAIELIEWANRPGWDYGREFLAHWCATVRDEQEGRSLSTAPAAWIHLGQELATSLESEEDWIFYLRSRWRTVEGNLSRGRRAAYGAMGVSAFGLGALILGFAAHGLIVGEMDLWKSLAQAGREQWASNLLSFGRILGAAMMVEHGYYWGKRALSGKSLDPEAIFIPALDGLKLLP